ncbi:MAG: VOC family protein [Lysobacterales bacterium]
METLSFKRVDHVSLTVAELKPVIEFYTRVFGATLAYEMGPFDAAESPTMDDGRDWTDAHINVPAARLSIAMLSMPDGMGMELFHYEKPDDAVESPPRNCDIGCRHLCIEVENLDASVAFLKDNGCTPMAGSIDMAGAPCPDSRSWYVLDPFGHQLELVEYS